MSRPHSNAVNDHIQIDHYRYKSVDNAVSLMTPGCFFALVDIQQAYRWIPVYPPHQQLQGFQWAFGNSGNKASFFIDKRLCFGLRNAPSIFHRISNAITRMMRKKGISCIVNYLDDFLIVSPSHEECQRALLALIRLLTSLGFGINWKKVVSPTTCITFLGIELNSITMEASMPNDKLSKLSSTVENLLKRPKSAKVKKRELQSIAGLMNFAAIVVKGARTFMRRLLDLLKPLKRQNHRTRLNSEARKDLIWWAEFLRLFNGKAVVINNCCSPCVNLYSDASLTGFGAWYNDDWIAGTWTTSPTFCKQLNSLENWFPACLPENSNVHINTLELYAILLAVRHWAPAWRDHRVGIHTDNTQVMYGLNKGSSNNKESMSALREIFWWSVIYNFTFSAHHIPGYLNNLADSLSRLAQSENNVTWLLQNLQ